MPPIVHSLYSSLYLYHVPITKKFLGDKKAKYPISIVSCSTFAQKVLIANRSDEKRVQEKKYNEDQENKTTQRKLR